MFGAWGLGFAAYGLGFGVEGLGLKGVNGGALQTIWFFGFFCPPPQVPHEKALCALSLGRS